MYARGKINESQHKILIEKASEYYSNESINPDDESHRILFVEQSYHYNERKENLMMEYILKVTWNVSHTEDRIKWQNKSIRFSESAMQ